MKIFEQTPVDVWQIRRSWIDNELDSYCLNVGECEASPHAIALFNDMTFAFCAGAWISVVVMSISVIDAQLRETESANEKVKTVDLLKEYYKGENIDWLRRLRNQYVHVEVGSSWFVNNDFYERQDELEQNAIIAIEMTIKALFQTPILP